MPLVSVIMPYYKKINFVINAINSVLNQSFQNFELILIYDDTNLSDLEIIKNEFKNNTKLKIIKNKENFGAGISRNIGISQSMGEIIAFIDSDDYWFKQKLEKQLNFMNNNNLDFTFCNYEKKISDPHIGHTLKISPTQRIIDWVNENFKAIGNENNFNVTILDASLTQIQFKNKDAKNLDKKINYKYELFFLVEYNLYDNSNNLIASTLVEAKRSTTSGVYISIVERENIINDLIYQTLVDLTDESKKLITKYMIDFIL